ncbi:hypothetical protein CK203_065496 [Vitis vinifera]|uniref:Uncharacterized protein n=1 Tax=Vitis vinifera TaxID=29760 RepID=A0A438G6A8_VITVI|nr:hypothetical protein CK203_065496 [Vitis vinifera]
MRSERQPHSMLSYQFLAFYRENLTSFQEKALTIVSFPTCKRCFLINRGPVPVRRNPNSKPKPSRWFRPSTQ